MFQIVIYQMLHAKESFYDAFRNKKKLSEKKKKYFFSKLCQFEKPAYQVDNFKPFEHYS